jgi:hypothetical protein
MMSPLLSSLRSCLKPNLIWRLEDTHDVLNPVWLVTTIDPSIAYLSLLPWEFVCLSILL